MKSLLSAACTAAALALAGCPAEEPPEEEDEPHPLTGIYTVTTHTVAEPCDAEALPPEPPITRFKLAEDSFFFVTYLAFFDCSESLPPEEEKDEDGCSTIAQLELSAIPPDDEVDISSCSCFDGGCNVTGFEGGWQETDGGAALAVDRLAGELPGEEEGPDGCDPSALFEEHKDELTCETRTVIEGTRE